MHMVVFTYSKLTENEKNSKILPTICPKCGSKTCFMEQGCDERGNWHGWLHGLGAIRCSSCGFADQLIYTHYYESAAAGDEFLARLSD